MRDMGMSEAEIAEAEAAQAAFSASWADDYDDLPF